MKEKKDEMQKEMDSLNLSDMLLLLKALIVGGCIGGLISIAYCFSYWYCVPVVTALGFYIIIFGMEMRKKLNPDKQFSIWAPFFGFKMLLKLAKDFVLGLFLDDVLTFAEEELWDAEEKLEKVQQDSEQWKNISDSLQLIKEQLEGKDEESSPELLEAKQALEGLEELANAALESFGKKEAELKAELPELESEVEEEDRVGEIYMDFLNNIGRVALWSIVLSFIYATYILL